MKFILFTFIIIVFVVILFGNSVRAQYSVSREQITTADQVSPIFSKLLTSTSYPAFAAFIFGTPDKVGDDGAINIQFSIENGKPGVDWVLLAPRNVADQDKFIGFVKAKGFAPKFREGNGVKYIRVEDGDLTGLCIAVITELYGVPKDAQIGLVVMGFDWGNAPGERSPTHDIIITKKR